MRTLLGLVFALPVAAQQPAAPCNTPEHRQFDFWIGTWDVFARGQRVGENVIDTIYGGCVLRERYNTAPRPYAGSSFNIYDASRRVWHQTWVDTGGLLLLIEGGLVNGAMVMEGHTVGARGPVRNRITWTPIARDSVRQHWETWSDSASTWVTAFDGMYVRR
jgi:hypothetical protein